MALTGPSNPRELPWLSSLLCVVSFWFVAPKVVPYRRDLHAGLCAGQFWEAAWSQAFKELLGGNRVLLSRGAGSRCNWALGISVNYP